MTRLKDFLWAVGTVALWILATIAVTVLVTWAVPLHEWVPFLVRIGWLPRDRSGPPWFGAAFMAWLLVTVPLMYLLYASWKGLHQLAPPAHTGTGKGDDSLTELFAGGFCMAVVIPIQILLLVWAPDSAGLIVAVWLLIVGASSGWTCCAWLAYRARRKAKLAPGDREEPRQSVFTFLVIRILAGSAAGLFVGAVILGGHLGINALRLPDPFLPGWVYPAILAATVIPAALAGARYGWMQAYG